jgi:hypothetical protein
MDVILIMMEEQDDYQSDHAGNKSEDGGDGDEARMGRKVSGRPMTGSLSGCAN